MYEFKIYKIDDNNFFDIPEIYKSKHIIIDDETKFTRKEIVQYKYNEQNVIFEDVNVYKINFVNTNIYMEVSTKKVNIIYLPSNDENYNITVFYTEENNKINSNPLEDEIIISKYLSIDIDPESKKSLLLDDFLPNSCPLHKGQQITFRTTKGSKYWTIGT